jgi:hypothetical protein
MIRYAGRAVLCAVLLAGLGRAAGAQTASPSPVPPAAPAGFTAHAHANVDAVMSGNQFNAVARFALAQRASLLRIDILSLTSGTFPLPPLTGTAVIDHGARTVTVWNDTTRRYYVQSLIPQLGRSASPRPSASPHPSASPRPRASATPAPAQHGSPFRNLEVLSMTLRMTGHTTTAGVPTTGLAFDLQVQNRGDHMPTHVTANTQIADDYAMFPVTADVSIEPAAGTFNAKLAYAVDDLTPGLPPAESFRVPAGYTKASSVFEVFGMGGGFIRGSTRTRTPAAPAVTPGPAATRPPR